MSIRFTVEGYGEFPIDMLRYDQCYPATEADAYFIQQGQGVRQVVLVSDSESKQFGPTRGRWESFLWSVLNWEIL